MEKYPFLVEDVVALVKTAGETVMKYYEKDFAVYEKSDLSPVTDADIAAEEIIFNGLKKVTPDIPVVGEEHVAEGGVPSLTGRYFWLVDPIDGTKEFIKKNGEFTINIGLIDGDTPIFGAVYAPAADELYFTQSPKQAFGIQNGKTFLMKTRAIPRKGYTIMVSRSHFREKEAERLIGKRRVAEFVTRGSSLKFCEVAAGRADLYPCTHPTHEWDTAAAHAILNAAGGVVVDEAGQPLLYRKKGLENPYILSFGDVSGLKE